MTMFEKYFNVGANAFAVVLGFCCSAAVVYFFGLFLYTSVKTILEFVIDTLNGKDKRK